MNRRHWAVLALLISLLGLFALAPREISHVTPPGDPGATFGNWALAFEENVGQAAAPIRFVAHGAGDTLYFLPDGVVVAPTAPRAAGPPGAAFAARRAAPATAAPAMQLRFLDANPAPTLTRSAALSGQVNYLVGNDPARWQTGLPTFARLTYQDLYPGIDLTYGGSGRTLKGTYTLAPGADPTAIRWRYDCGTPDTTCAVTLDAAGNLQIRARDDVHRTGARGLARGGRGAGGGARPLYRGCRREYRLHRRCL